MLQEAHDKLGATLSKRDNGFRWRGREISRIEGLSDAVFAFAITLLVVSLEPPKRFEELQHLMHGFLSFALCFTALLLIWHSQYIYFRRYALDDAKSFILNAFLLFLVAFYVYPLRFLMSTLINMLTRYHEVDKNGTPIEYIQAGDWTSLMLIYSVGFIAIYFVFALLYLHAYSKRDDLDLNDLERFDTRNVIFEHSIMIGIGALSAAFALAQMPSLSGMAYLLIGPFQTVWGMMNGKRRRALESAIPAPT